MKTPRKAPQLAQIVQAARSLPEIETAPYAFEKRVMQAIRSARPADLWNVWAQTMWRAAAACVAITVVTGAFMTFEEEREELLAADLEQTVLAPMTLDEPW